ncbi:peptide chain release factor N(5)-glutamine methyltransferase [Psychromarinibacter sp. C21-152]|uniref:Release factor glutamine methyltransferase n=1 Tax=Psychromarinibacter sediminicola TaxID=3033385 RepID=A0AAE3T803_9RHOB|nr:peptide chain release factor N(5)-glutamine methyltransferase [Psychromarinibacter sediminicola]MDF0600890.1 peptide chain release factor N(5)-glutamine methyltransferase [Psychromarinibacter sediminicola]
MSGQAALAAGIATLRDAGVETPERDARALLAEAAGWPRDRLTLHLPEALSDVAEADFFHMVQLRAGRRPVARILGRRQFWDRWFTVTPDVLDPRPETELLVSLALAEPFSQLLDLGTGTGILAVTLLAERPGATGVATDISPAALEVAARNAAAHGVADRLWLTESDWYAGVAGRFDLILSNPPYIAAAEMAGLAPEVREHDPRAALTDGGDGLSAYRAIAAGAGAHLAPGGRLLVEIGAGQGAAVREIFGAAGLDDVAHHADLEDRPRVVSGRRR